MGVTGLAGVTGIRGLTGGPGIDGAWTGMLCINFKGGVSGISPGFFTDVQVPIRFKIGNYSLLLAETGGMSLNIRKTTYTNFPDLLTGMHAGATGPYVGNGIKNSGTLSGWTGAAQDIIRITVNSCYPNVDQASLNLCYNRF
jgi:hypothetical protein